MSNYTDPLSSFQASFIHYSRQNFRWHWKKDVEHRDALSVLDVSVSRRLETSPGLVSVSSRNNWPTSRSRSRSRNPMSRSRLGLAAKRLGLGHLALFNNSGNVSHSHHVSIKSQRERGSMFPFHVAVFPVCRFPLGRVPRRIFSCLRVLYFNGFNC